MSCQGRKDLGVFGREVGGPNVALFFRGVLKVWRSAGFNLDQVLTALFKKKEK